jgi:hypothetical protein
VTCTAGEITSVTVGYVDVDVEGGVGAASKAVVLNSSGNYTMPDGGFMDLSNAAIAALGTAQSSFAVIADQINAVTGADGTKGVALPAASSGRAIFILNTSQTLTLPVSPINSGNDQINSLTTGTGVFTMGPARGAWFFPVSATQWYVTGDAAIVGTPTEQDLDGLTANVTELNYSDTALPGTVVASKNVIYDSAGKTFHSSATPAAAGAASQGDSTLLASQVNYVTGANASAGVRLPVPAADQVIIVINSVVTAGNYLNVYPSTDTQINALGNNAAYQLNPGQIGIFVGRSTILWNIAAAADTISGLTAAAAELNFNDTALAGTVVASKTMVADAQKAVDTLRATTTRTIGGTGVPGAAAVQTEITKAVTAFTDTVAKDVFTVTVPNAVHQAVIEIDAIGVMGAGGVVGAGESCRNVKYQVAVNRFTGADAIATVSAAIGGAASTTAGGAAITSVVATASAMTGAVGAEQTFTILFAITKAGGAGDNHTLVASARVLNQNATGVTIA